MADKPQSFKNHTRLDPLFHQFLGPLSFILLIAAVTSFVRNVELMTAFQVVAAIWAVVATFKIRLYALKVQDRIIRLEERLRMHELFSEPLRSRIGEFTESQLWRLFVKGRSIIENTTEDTDGSCKLLQVPDNVGDTQPTCGSTRHSTSGKL